MQTQTQNPWLTIWTEPRGTIRGIVDANPQHRVILLAILSGIAQFLSRASNNSLGDKVPIHGIFLVSLIIGPILGVVSLYIGGVILMWTGRWLGGQASAVEVRAALAWSSVPTIWALVLWIPEIVLFGDEMFTKMTPIIDANPNLSFVLVGFGVIEIIIAIWTTIIFLKCLGEVHGFSAWRALVAFILPSLIFIIPIICIALLLLFGPTISQLVGS